MSCSSVTPDEAAVEQRHAGLERPLLVQHERVRHAAVAEGGQTVITGHVGGRLRAAISSGRQYTICPVRGSIHPCAVP